MRKTVFILLLFAGLAGKQSYGQVTGVPYEDAVVFLKNIAAGGDINKVAQIVSYYFDDNTVTLGNVDDRLTINPFLKKYARPVGKRGTAADAAFNGGATSGGNNTPGLSVTNIADGLAKFLIERAKQELSMAFFDKFKKDLKKFPELKYLFPKSVDILDKIESYNIQNFLQELKDAFSKDLLTIPASILSLRNITEGECPTDACKIRVKKINEIFASPHFDARFIVLPLLTAQGIMDGNNIIEISNKISADPSVCSKNDDVSGLFQLSSILLESFRTNKDGGIFLSQVQFKNLFYSEDMLNVFIGLTYQKFNKKSCYSDLTIRGLQMEKIFNKIIEGRMKFYSLLTSFDKINLPYTGLKGAIDDGKEPDKAVYASVVVASVNMLSNLVSTIDELIPGSLPANLKKIKMNLDFAGQLCSDISQKNYAGIFNLTIKVINENNIFGDSETSKKLATYLSFAANLASASNSDEVKEAINAVALPPGSYSIKQKSSLNVSLNGYIGYAWDINSGNGISAPVGISVSTGLGKKGGGALTLFSSLIDVGSIASYRLHEGNTDELKQEIRLESIFTPSAQLFFAIPRFPIVIGGGWRRTPKLFYSGQSTFLPVAPKSVFNISVLIDIPIFTIKNSPYR